MHIKDILLESIYLFFDFICCTRSHSGRNSQEYIAGGPETVSKLVLIVPYILEVSLATVTVRTLENDLLLLCQ